MAGSSSAPVRRRAVESAVSARLMVADQNVGRHRSAHRSRSVICKLTNASPIGGNVAGFPVNLLIIAYALFEARFP